MGVVRRNVLELGEQHRRMTRFERRDRLSTGVYLAEFVARLVDAGVLTYVATDGPAAIEDRYVTGLEAEMEAMQGEARRQIDEVR